MLHLITGKCSTLTFLRPFARHLVGKMTILAHECSSRYAPARKRNPRVRTPLKTQVLFGKALPSPSPIGFYHQHFQLNFVAIRGKPFHTTTPVKNSPQFLDTDTSESKKATNSSPQPGFWFVGLFME